MLCLGFRKYRGARCNGHDIPVCPWFRQERGCKYLLYMRSTPTIVPMFLPCFVSRLRLKLLWLLSRNCFGLLQVDEYMGRAENAVVFYSKAVHLLVFLQVEAPSLILNPPFSLTNSDRFRLQNYINVLNNRQSVSRSQMVALLKCEDQRFSWQMLIVS